MKNKFNIIDGVIILVVVAAILFVGAKFFKIGDTVSSDHFKDAVYTVRINGLLEVSMKEIPDKGEVKDGSGIYMGKIISRKVETATEINQLSDGSYKKIENNNKYDVYLEISCKGIQKEDGFYFDGKKNYGINSNIYLDAETVAFEGKILDLEVEK